MSEEKVEEKGGFEEFASKALRLRRRGSYENLLCQHLIMSVNAQPLTKVRLVCEACWMVVDPQKVKLDNELVETIYAVASSLLNVNPQADFFDIPWAFPITDKNYSRYIKPWRRKTSLAFVYDCESTRQEKSEIVDNAESEAQLFRLYTKSLNLHSGSFRMLKAEFLTWAIPQVMQIFEKLSRLVQPDLYREMLQALTKTGAVQT